MSKSAILRPYMQTSGAALVTLILAGDALAVTEGGFRKNRSVRDALATQAAKPPTCTCPVHDLGAPALPAKAATSRKRPAKRPAPVVAETPKPKARKAPKAPVETLVIDKKAAAAFATSVVPNKGSAFGEWMAAYKMHTADQRAAFATAGK